MQKKRTGFALQLARKYFWTLNYKLINERWVTWGTSQERSSAATWACLKRREGSRSSGGSWIIKSIKFESTSPDTRLKEEQKQYLNYLLDFSKRYKIVIGSRQISQIFFDHKEGNKFFLESEFKINEMICELRNIWNEKLIEFTFLQWHDLCKNRS